MTGSFRFAWLVLLASFATFMTVSGAFLQLNGVASVVGGLVALGGTTLVALATSGREWRSATGLLTFRPGDVALGVVLGVTNALSLSAWLGALSTAVFPKVLVELFDTGAMLKQMVTNPLERAAMVLAVAVLAPLAEELLFRGVLVRGLVERLSPLATAVVSGFIFSAYHLDPVGFLPRFAIGIMLALLVLKSGSLWPAIAAHAANNALALGTLEAGLEDSDLPVWVGLASLVVLLATGAWLKTRPTVEGPTPLPRAPHPFLRAVAPWGGSLVASALLLATLDARGGQLTRIDLTAPLVGRSDDAELTALLELRAQARRGELSCEAYGERRRAVSHARLQALLRTWLSAFRRRDG
ncbi:MAG: CPBP family intramembrane metalloprotease [Myxococcaceae bacterium]|nr:CPBP family intramembrane metalloprotease [Myxococcaceae bacterium]MCA3011446.1 CPBP family intramembrane metalloprotease [Myxococcaceae bacterium]